MTSAKAVAAEFVNFLNKAISPYHVVEECAKLLQMAGFKELCESDAWKLEPLHKYYLTRNRSTIIAFAIGGKFEPGNGVSMVAAHTDSPCLRVKPISKLSGAGCMQIGVMTYGGGLWRTWFDRDLTVAGRVMVLENGNVRQRLVHIKETIMSIPSLAIHLDRDSNEKFVFNKEDHLRPILATQIANRLNGGDSSVQKCETGKEQDHHEEFLQKIADEAGVNSGHILDLDLCVIDTQPATIGGLNGDFIYGARLDNLIGTYSAITSLINSLESNDALVNDPNIRLVACFDHEECGSESAQGAASSLTEWILRRLQQESCVVDAARCSFERSIARSLLISVDQAHAQHPNYASKHEDKHAPRFHGGPVVKLNANQRYATSAATHALLKLVAQRAQVPLQKFVVRNDSLCGSTVGPILSAKLGLRTIDVGMPQLAMHSIREMACTSSVFQAQKLFVEFFNCYHEISQCFNETQ